MPQTITFHEPDRVWIKDPDEIDTWTIDWSNWLKADTISTSAWYMDESTPSNITVSGANDTTTATATISSGSHGGRYVLTNRITTAAGLVKEKKLVIRVLDTEYRRLCH